MVKAELALFEVEVEGVSWDAFEPGEAMFGEGPEGFDAVDVTVAANEFVISMMGPEVFGVADIDQALVPRQPSLWMMLSGVMRPRMTFCNVDLRASGTISV